MNADLHITIPSELIDTLERFVADGRFKDVSDAIATAVTEYARRETGVEEQMAAFRAEVI